MARMGKIGMNGKELVAQCKIATDFFTRFMGLMGRTQIPSTAGVFFPNCNSIHTFFMRMPIDVIFIARSGEVMEILPRLGPWRMLLPRSGVRHTLELGAGQASALGIRVGTKLTCEGILD
jgi:uncharacterized protein